MIDNKILKKANLKLLSILLSIDIISKISGKDNVNLIYRINPSVGNYVIKLHSSNNPKIIFKSINNQDYIRLMKMRFQKVLRCLNWGVNLEL